MRLEQRLMETQQELESAGELQVGDYVLATKYDDGDPQDQWSVGFFNGIMQEYLPAIRYDVVDEKGLSFRGNGFRKVQVISCETGKWLIDNIKNIEYSDKSLWDLIKDDTT